MLLIFCSHGSQSLFNDLWRLVFNFQIDSEQRLDLIFTHHKGVFKGVQNISVILMGCGREVGFPRFPGVSFHFLWGFKVGDRVYFVEAGSVDQPPLCQRVNVLCIRVGKHTAFLLGN